MKTADIFIKENAARLASETEPIGKEGYFYRTEVVKLMEEYASFRNQGEAGTDGKLTEDEIYELGKREVAYDRQLAVIGKKDADCVLYFWMKGYNYAKQYTPPSIQGEVSKEQIIEALEKEVKGLWKTTDVLIDHQAEAILKLFYPPK